MPVVLASTSLRFCRRWSSMRCCVTTLTDWGVSRSDSDRPVAAEVLRVV